MGFFFFFLASPTLFTYLLVDSSNFLCSRPIQAVGSPDADAAEIHRSVLHLVWWLQHNEAALASGGGTIRLGPLRLSPAHRQRVIRPRPPALIERSPPLPPQVCGVEALKNFSKNFVTPYEPSFIRGTLEELELRVSTLRLQLKEAEAELIALQKGKQKAWREPPPPPLLSLGAIFWSRFEQFSSWCKSGTSLSAWASLLDSLSVGRFFFCFSIIWCLSCSLSAPSWALFEVGWDHAITGSDDLCKLITQWCQRFDKIPQLSMGLPLSLSQRLDWLSHFSL